MELGYTLMEAIRSLTVYSLVGCCCCCCHVPLLRACHGSPPEIRFAVGHHWIAISRAAKRLLVANGLKV